jgi:hypothetical protein
MNFNDDYEWTNNNVSQEEEEHEQTVLATRSRLVIDNLPIFLKDSDQQRAAFTFADEDTYVFCHACRTFLPPALVNKASQVPFVFEQETDLIHLALVHFANHHDSHLDDFIHIAPDCKMYSAGLRAFLYI